MYNCNSKACGSKLVTSKTNGNASIPRSLLCTIQNFLTRQRVPISTFECLERPMNEACTIYEAVGYGQRKLWTFCGKRIEIIECFLYASYERTFLAKRICIVFIVEHNTECNQPFTEKRQENATLCQHVAL